MEIFVQTPSGTLTAEVLPTDTIESVRAAIYRGSQVAPRDRVLTFGGRVLYDGRHLADYAVRGGDTIEAGRAGTSTLLHVPAAPALSVPQIPTAVPAALVASMIGAAVVRGLARRGGHPARPRY